jgi:hypothetical protein
MSMPKYPNLRQYDMRQRGITAACVETPLPGADPY